jgi:hypothetical protein
LFYTVFLSFIRTVWNMISRVIRNQVRPRSTTQTNSSLNQKTVSNTVFLGSIGTICDTRARFFSTKTTDADGIQPGFWGGFTSLGYNPRVRKRLRNARRYACYYGENELEKLLGFEAVILQPRKYDASALERLRKAGVITLAYLSAGEEDPAQLEADETPETLPWVKYDPDGKPQHNQDWHSLIVNPHHPGWRARVLERAKRYRAQGFSGFFLDALDAESDNDRRALAKLVREVRTGAPAAPIMINRGFKLLELVQDAVDGVMFESLSCTWRALPDGTERYEPVSSTVLDQHLKLVRKVNAIAERWEIARFALDYTDNPELEAHATATAESLGFVSFTSNRLLTRL